MTTHHRLLLLIFLFSLTSSISSLNNGLLRTPPMGWMSWLKYACTIDCKTYPSSCINEALYKDMINAIISDGYLKLGYDTVNIDDCWPEKSRHPITHELVADRGRFPSGIRALADYAHGKGVKLGIYGDVGTLTCGAYPGTRDGPNGTVDYTLLDASTFSGWGVDSLKLDGCYEPDWLPFNQSYPEYTRALAKQSHKIAFACSWPAYIDVANLTTADYALIRDSCNYWRNFDDIMDSWPSVQSIIEFYRQHVGLFKQYHGPGAWFDPDMLIIGNDGLSLEQSRTQMAFWCLWSAPLLMSNDLRAIGPEFKAILQNRHLIGVDQDPLGIMGHVVVEKGCNKAKTTCNHQVWVKKLSPETPNGPASWAVLYFNQDVIGVPTFFAYQLSSLIPQLSPDLSYNVLDLFADASKLTSLTANQTLRLEVPTSGSVRMVKLVPKH